MKILVVDDEKDMQLLFEQRFRNEIREGLVTLAFAFSGEEALYYLNQHDQETRARCTPRTSPAMPAASA
jgi:CheY-like chemotaxis protein